MQQRSTLTNLRIRSTTDAHVIFYAVSLGLLPIVSRRLDTEERRSITTGDIFVWEERGPGSEATGVRVRLELDLVPRLVASELGIERWTDSIRWGPSRVRDEFLYYHEKPVAATKTGMADDSGVTSRPLGTQNMFRHNLIKQTYSVFVDTLKGRRKWHLIAYFTAESISYLRRMDDVPELAQLRVPPGQYTSARAPKWSRGSRTMERCDQARLSYLPPPFYHHHAFCASYTRHTLPTLSNTPLRADDYFSPSFFETMQAPQNATPSTPPHSPITRRGHKIGLPYRIDNELSDMLAPLVYLQSIAPVRRHPVDEKALMALRPRLPT